MSCDVGQYVECHFTYVIAHTPTLLSPYLRHSSFSNPSVALLRHSSFSNLSVTSPTSQLILQPLPRFTYVTIHSPTIPLLHLRHSSFSTLLSLLLRHRVFTYVTWRAAHLDKRYEIGEEESVRNVGVMKLGNWENPERPQKYRNCTL